MSLFRTPLAPPSRSLTWRALAGASLLCVLSRGAIAQSTSADPTVTLLQELIRINTSNPPGTTLPLAELLKKRFEAVGYTVEIFPTPEVGKVHFIARLKGDGSKKPLLLAAHADVVGVEREKWTVDPFAGIIKDGKVYGRGAVDFKGGMAVFAIAALRLAEKKVPLARDVIFMAEADEEGAPLNTSWLAKDHWTSMDAEFAINEGGWIMKNEDGSVRYVSISTLDKQSISVLLSSKGTSTHSSMPVSDNPLASLGAAIAKIAAYEAPVELTPDNKLFFLTLAKTSKGATANFFRQLVNGTPAQVKAASAEISKDPLMHAIMRNTFAPVIMNGGFRSNVIPGSAEATVNMRIIPGTDPNAMVALLEKLVNDKRITIKLGNTQTSDNKPTPSPTSSELYRALETEAKAQWPNVEVTPYTFQAGTDAGAWRSRGVPTYGIYPYPISKDELQRMHGNDERVSIASLQQGTEMMYRTLVRVAGKH